MIIGIDPGKSGGIAFDVDNLISVYSFKNKSETEIAACVELLTRGAREKGEVNAYLEKVHSAPGQGVASMFTFGEAYGFIRGVLSAYNIPIIDVTPQTWQRTLRIPSRNGKTYAEHKKLLRSIADKLYPNIKTNAETADALLILHYGKIIENNMDI